MLALRLLLLPLCNTGCFCYYNCDFPSTIHFVATAAATTTSVIVLAIWYSYCCCCYYLPLLLAAAIARTLYLLLPTYLPNYLPTYSLATTFLWAHTLLLLRVLRLLLPSWATTCASATIAAIATYYYS